MAAAIRNLPLVLRGYERPDWVGSVISLEMEADLRRQISRKVR